jgi:hypothetical protein
VKWETEIINGAVGAADQMRLRRERGG